MSSHADEGAQQPEAPTGDSPAAGGTAVPSGPAEAATAEADHDEAAPAPAAAGTGAEIGAEAGIGAGTAASAGAGTMVLDPEPEPDPDDELPAEQDRVSKLAVISIVTGVVALVPLAVPCSIAALIGIRRSGRRGRGMALAALFACADWLIVGGAVGAVGAITHGFHKPVTIKYHEAGVFKLRVGDCLASPNGQLTSCSTPHEAEVFATFALPASAWPGTAAVAAQASSGCASRLTGYLNPQLAVSLTQSYVYPNLVAWTAGTRTVVCEVHATSGELTGSVRGAA